VRGKIEATLEDTGEHNLKNIAQPVRIYRAVAAPGSRLREQPVPVDATAAQPVMPRPAIAILPLVSMSAESGQRFLADGITEDIITELSRFTTLTVIARNSSARFKDGPVDMKQIGRELGARYLVEGSLRGLGDKIRITIQLIDAESGGHLWAERFDRGAGDIAATDKAVQAIVTGLANRVAENEEERGRRGPEAGRTAYHFMLQARELMQDGDYIACEAPLRRAIELDPSLSEAHGLLVHALIQKYLYGENEGDLAEAEHSARQAIALNPRGSGPQFGMAYVALTQGNHDLAGLHLNRPIALNPNNVNAQIGRAQWLLWGGQAEQALAAVEASIEREELAPPYYWEARAEILFQLHRYGESLEAIARVNRAHFWIKALAVAALAQSQNLDEARRQLAALLAAQPMVTIAKVMKANAYRDQALREHFVDGLRKAGTPA
jgi:TolB-like protein